MGYKILQQSGNLVETYEYKYDYIQRRIKSRTRAVRRRGVAIRNRRADNLYRLGGKFSRLVRANLVGGKAPLFVTFTVFEDVSVGIAYNYLSRCIQRLRGGFGKTFRYVAVPEFTKRGRIHFHMLVWGLDYEAETERSKRYIQWAWRRGFVDCIQTDGSPKLAGYLTKYMRKSMSDERLISEKAYVCSRNVMRSVRSTFSTAFQYLSEIVGDSKPNKVSVYKTQWLGNCKYTRYLLDFKNV